MLHDVIKPSDDVRLAKAFAGFHVPSVKLFNKANVTAVVGTMLGNFGRIQRHPASHGPG